jgi:hypothetical protein
MQPEQGIPCPPGNRGYNILQATKISSIMQDPAHRTRKVFIWSFFVVTWILALLFIFFFVSTRCSRIIIGDYGTSDCLIGVSVFWLEGAFLVLAVFSLYRVNRLMQGKG